MVRPAAVLLAVCAAASCASDGVPAAAAPGRCPDAAARTAVTRFAADLSAGRLAAADRRWAREPAFEWYSTPAPGERIGAGALDRSTLRAYFRARIAARERLRVSSLRTHGDRRRGLRHFEGTVSRRAADVRARRYAFKGAVDCATRRLIVWSMSPA